MSTFNSKIKMWIAAFVLSGLIILIVDRAYQFTGGAKNIAPGWTETEFNWRFSRPHSGSRILVVGASNVNWAIAETVMSKHLSNTCNVNVDVANIGLSGHNTMATLERLSNAKLPSSIIIYSYDPISAGVFSRKAPVIRNTVLRQEQQDSAIAINIGEVLPTFMKTPEELIQHFFGKKEKPKTGQLYWAKRTSHPQGMVSGTRHYYGSSEVPSYSDLATDQKTRLEARLTDFFSERVEPTAMKNNVNNLLAKLKRQGHTIYLTHVPQSLEIMRVLQDGTPKEFQLQNIVTDEDFTTIKLEPAKEYYDGSHVTYSGALEITARLSRKLAEGGLCERLD